MMDLINIFIYSLLPAIVYSFIIFITVPYSTIKIKTGLKYLVGGFLSIVFIFTFFKVFPGWHNLSDNLFDKNFYPLKYLHFDIFIQVSLLEESIKLGFFFLFERVLNDEDAPDDHPVTTMFYVGMVSLGFSVIENIKYAVDSPSPMDTLLWRSVTAVIGHMVFGLFMGYWIALGRVGPRLKNRSLFDVVVLRNEKLRRNLFVVIGLLAATILHGIYDLHISIHGNGGISGLYMLLIMSVLGVFWCFKNLNKIHNEKLSN